MDVAIFGAGIAGLMTAITLHAQGHRCRIFERSRQAHDAGMGFILAPEGIACMEGFGVHLAGALGGTLLEHYYCRDATGQIVLEQTMPSGVRGIRRRDLTAALVRALSSEKSLIFGAELDSLEFDEDFQVTSARLNSSAGGERIQADLYVDAAGINSRTRRALFPAWPATPDRVPEIVGLVRCVKTARWAGPNFNKFHAQDGGAALGILPVDGEHVIWYLQFDALRFAPSLESLSGNSGAGAEARRAFAESLVGGWGEPIPSLVAMTDFSRVHLWRPIETELVPYFHRGNLVLVGDAAHPLSPFTSRGVSSAMADAEAMGRAVHKDVSPGAGLVQALARYSNERRAQRIPYIAKGRELKQHFLEPLSVGKCLLPIA